MWRVGEWLAVLWPRPWWYSWRQARHVIRATEEEAAEPGWVFRGSMNLDDERATLNGLPVYGVPGARGDWVSGPEFLPAPVAGWDEAGERLLPAPPDDDEGDATAAWFASLSDDPGLGDSDRTGTPGPDQDSVCNAMAPRVAARTEREQVPGGGGEPQDAAAPTSGGDWRAEQLAWVQDVNAWLYEWVRDMVPHVTGWSAA